MLDEVEEFNLLMSHYAFTVSSCSRNAGKMASEATVNASSGISCCDIYNSFVQRYTL